MKLDLKFKENSQKLDLKFGQFQDLTDGGYERGYAEGEKVGYSNGYTDGETKGKEQGYAEGYNEGTIPSYYIGEIYGLYDSVVFPENSEIYLRLAKLFNQNAGYVCRKTKNLKKLTLEIGSTEFEFIYFGGFIRENTDIEILDFSNLGVKIGSVDYFALGATKLKSIYGALDFSECTVATLWLNSANALEDIEFVPNTIKISIDFYWCTKLSKASLTSIINGLSAETSGLTVTLSKTAVNKAFETSEGANDGSTSAEWLALIATKPNWNISLV